MYGNANKANIATRRRNVLALEPPPGVMGEESTGLPVSPMVALGARFEMIGPELLVSNEESGNCELDGEASCVARLPVVSCEVVTVNPELLLMKTLMSPETSCERSASEASGSMCLPTKEISFSTKWLSTSS